jgi:hypothetical protein
MTVDFDDLDTYSALLRVCKRYAVHPSSSLAAEEFFRGLLEEFDRTGDKESLENWLDQRLPQLFSAVGERPRWIQDPAWPFSSGKPMIFIGQIDCSIEHESVAASVLHDDSAFYIFIAEKAVPVVVVQQY